MQSTPSVFEEALDEKTHVVGMRGEADFRTAPHFQKELSRTLSDPHKRAVVDLSEVSFMDSTTLGALLNAHRRVSRRGGRLPIVCTDPGVLKLFAMTALDRTFEITSSREEALGLIAAS